MSDLIPEDAPSWVSESGYAAARPTDDPEVWTIIKPLLGGRWRIQNADRHSCHKPFL